MSNGHGTRNGANNSSGGSNGGLTWPPRHICATDQLDRILISEEEGYRSRRQAVEQFTRLAKNAPSMRTGQVHIPVVVHVVYNTAEQNISLEQINEQIRVLNEDFNAQNPDLTTLQPVWKDLVANPNIRFFLAVRDPKGNPTDGVTRTKTTLTAFDQFGNSLDRRMKFKAQKGQDGWPSDMYLNIWVCNTGSSGILGYATFPAMGSPKEDGVVINYSAFGVGGTARDPFNLGRTTTHEVGHWLNLRHIWGDDDEEVGPNAECSLSDLCDDTPNQAWYNSGKPQFPHITCDNGPNGDLFQNYMDYSDDDTCVMFTKGQVSRIDATLAGPRSSLLGSNFTELRIQSSTSLPQEETLDMFFSTDWTAEGAKDLIAINKLNSQLKVLSAASGFKDEVLGSRPIGYKVDASNSTVDFAIGNWTGDSKPDLFIFQTLKGARETEVVILSGKSNFEEIIFETKIAIADSSSKYAYEVAKQSNFSKAAKGKPDIYILKRPSQPGNSYSAEIKVLSGDSGFKSVVFEAKSTSLSSENGSLELAITDWTGDGTPDLVAIKKSNSCKSATEVTVLSGVSHFKDVIFKTVTAWKKTEKNFTFLVGDWTGDGRVDLVGIKKLDTQSEALEIHVMAG